MKQSRRDIELAARVLVDGRLVTQAAVTHGQSSTYINYGCHCEPCMEAHRVAQADQRAKLRARRVLIDGRLVAPLPPDQHGLVSTFSNHGCQCDPCRAIHAARMQQVRERQAKRRTQA